MLTSTRERPLTLLDVVATVSGLTADEEEAAEVINHMLSSERIAFANPLPRREFERWLS
jgi:hypothetical protein